MESFQCQLSIRNGLHLLSFKFHLNVVLNFASLILIGNLFLMGFKFPFFHLISDQVQDDLLSHFKLIFLISDYQVGQSFLPHLSRGGFSGGKLSH